MRLLFILALVAAAKFSSVYADWALVWSDEFNGAKISDKWKITDNDCEGGGNNELQCYKNRRENIRVEKGRLILQARNDQQKNDGNKQKEFTSGKLTSKANWLHGKFEIRARMPKGKHLWPAIWMLPEHWEYGQWPRSGEIDITEYRGQKPNQILGTLHFGEAWNNKGDVGSHERDFNFDFSKDYHIFGLDWSPTQIQWIVDGQVYHTESLQRVFRPGPYNQNGQPFDKNFNLIINLAVGGNFFGNEPFDPSESKNWAKNTLEIDWVRKYEWR